MEQAGLDAARLSVVQHGTRASFRRRVMDAMRQLVPASGAFICFGTEDARAYGDSSRLVDGSPQPLKSDSAEPSGKGRGQAGIRLTHAFGFETKSVVETTRRVYLANELYPDDERMKLPYFASHAEAGMKHALLFFIHEGGVLFGLAGLERREAEGEFTQVDVERLEALGSFVAAGARVQIAYEELSREAAALRAFSKVSGTLFVVDRERKKVIWAANRERGIEWDNDVLPIEDHVVDAAEQSLQARAKQEALPTPPRLPAGAVVAVAKIEGDPVFNNAKCAILRVEPQEKAAPIEGLSKREREIARLLVAGYSGVNVAAISGLSENTVRTYVRRLYQKLGVSNRADLVRKLMSPAEAKSSTPSSVISPPPDSSLVDGDDTLD
jgi:DNA-binding CsgD family transcriptional regulator